MLAMDDSVLYYHGEKSYYDVEVFVSAAEGKMPNAKIQGQHIIKVEKLKECISIPEGSTPSP